MTDREMDEMERRSHATKKARAHVVTLDRCPCCGTRLGARDVAAIKRGEQQCPNRRPPADVLAQAAAILAELDRSRGAA